MLGARVRLHLAAPVPSTVTRPPRTRMLAPPPDATIAAMPSTLTVRAAGPDDAAVVAELNGIVQGIHYAAHPDRFPAPGAQRVGPAFRELLQPRQASLPGHSETRGWICESTEGTAIGYVIAVKRERPESPFTSPQRWVELDPIAVREDQRASGAGRLLALAVVAWAKELGVDTLELTVWEFNRTAQAFFAGLGFEPIQQRYAWRITES